MENTLGCSAEELLLQLVGMDNIIAQFEQYRKDWNVAIDNNSAFWPHMSFWGNPGTGKTEVARLFAEILHKDGILPQGQFIKTSPVELRSPYVGETRAKAQAVFNQAKGGILFIDDAYCLDNGYDDFGREAIEELFQFIAENQDTIIILTGYPDEMKRFFDKSPAVQRRFPNIFLFKDYSNDELVEIFLRKLDIQGYIVGETGLDFAREYFSQLTRDQQFGNAAEAEKLVSIVKARQSIRLQGVENPTEVEFHTILPQDFPNFKIDSEQTEDSSKASTSSPDDKEYPQITDKPRDTIPAKDMCPLDGNVNNREDKNEPAAMSDQIRALNESVMSIKEVIDNVQFNVAMLVQSQASAADVAVLQRENEAFRSDSNMKLMRRYGIDAMIKTYQAICDRIFRLKHHLTDNEANESEINTLQWVLKRIERQFKPLGIKLKSSQPGDAIDESYMVVYGSDGEDVEDSVTIIETDDVSLKGTIKESVCPAFLWTIPSLIGDVKEWCMEAEKVCIFK
jgi:hypothetical protein